MTQHSKIIDVTKSFTITDPNAFAENLEFSTSEDTVEKGDPIQAYEGYNFLPTSYGYRSFFGTSSVLDIAALPSRCDRVLLFQLANYKNILLALCEDGIWYSSSTSISGAVWTHGVVMTVPPVGTYKEFTYALINNTLYFYREGEASYNKIRYTDYTMTGITPNETAVLAFTFVVPTFLNMTGQMGIFRANLRLGFWDSANSISWSDLFDTGEFTPSVTTLAGNATFAGVVGRIVAVKPQGDNFVIYSTKGIVGVRYANTAAMLWEANTISDTAGIWYDHEVTSGINDNEHYAYTNTGIKHIGNYNVLNKAHVFEEILPDVYDLLKEAREPVYLDFMNGRYLTFSLINSDYINGKVSFVFNTVDALPVRILVGGLPWDGIYIPPTHISGQPITTAIANALATSTTSGMAISWIGALGTVCIPTITSGSFPFIEKTPAVPYSTDSTTAAHIANTPIYQGVTFNGGNEIPYANAAALDVLTGTDPANSVSYAIGGYIGWHIPASTGIPFLGTGDIFLAEMQATQIAEWDNFIINQNQNKMAIAAIPPYVAPVVQGNSPYLTLLEATTAKDLLQAAYVPVVSDVGSFLSGEGVVGLPSFTPGGHSYSSMYSISKVLTGGWTVRKTTTRVYSVREGIPLLAYTFSTVCDWTNWEPIIIGRTVVTTGFDIDITRAQNIAQMATELFPDPSFGGSASAYVVAPTAGFHYYYSTALQNFAYWIVRDSFPIGVPTIPYYIDYVDTTTISIVANPSITFTSTFTATQSVLEWAYFTPQQIQYGATGNFTSSYGAINVPGTGILGTSTLPLDLNITYPGATYLLQDGSPAPIYPTFSGALVFDTALKKWGKMKANYRCLIDYSPINTFNGTLSYTNLGIDMAMLEPVAAGKIRTFDARPADSWMRYGKLGFYRQGFTQAQEVKCHFRSSSTGVLEVDSSLDGRALEFSLTETYPFNLAASVTGYYGNSARWHTIKISGQFDLQYMEFRGNVAGRR